MKPLEELKKILPFSIGDDKILREVFVHSSYLNESEGKGLSSNERLEFLGDAVLETVISHMLFIRFPGLAEGDLTRLRARLVNKRKLAEISKGLALGDYLLLGKGERIAGGATKASMLADTFEALVAALYLDGGKDGFAKVYLFLEGLFAPLLNEAMEGEGHFDYKPALQEYCQSRLKKEPTYTTVGVDGPAHKRRFEVEVSINGRLLGRGFASKKKAAEQLAAKQALNALTER